MKLILKGLVLPGLNVWQRMHWAKRSRVKKDVLARVLVARGRQNERPCGRVAVVAVDMHRPRLLKDIDNLYASLKALLDALTSAGLIVDDSQEWTRLARLEQHKARRIDARVEVTITYEEKSCEDEDR